MKKITKILCLAASLLAGIMALGAQKIQTKAKTQKQNPADSLSNTKLKSVFLYDTVAFNRLFASNDPLKRGEALTNAFKALDKLTAYAAATQKVKEINASAVNQARRCETLLNAKEESDAIEPLLQKIGQAYGSFAISRKNNTSDKFVKFKDAADYKKLEDLGTFYNGSFLSDKYSLLFAITYYNCSKGNINPATNTPTYEALKASFVKYLGNISSKQRNLDAEQQGSTDALETRPENEYIIEGTKKGYYESYTNSYFGHNVWYVALIDDNITDDKKANDLYNDWKMLLTKCLNVNNKEDIKTDGRAFLRFESAYFKEYSNAHFKLTLRLRKDKDAYSLDFIVNDKD